MHNLRWELLAVYEMTNGKTIDEPGSGFDPHDPFANRDPRCLKRLLLPAAVSMVLSGILRQTHSK